jgi:Predicted membrane protein (DUF2142)
VSSRVTARGKPSPGAAQGKRSPSAAQGRLSLGAALGRVPTAAWICGLVACLNAVCWSVLTPAFQVPDEPAHFAYVQQLAETGHLPTSGEESYSPEEAAVRNDLRSSYVALRPQVPSVSSPAQQRRLELDLKRSAGRRGGGGAGLAAAEPPLYYALETIPYYLGSWGSLLDRLQLMRLLSALMAGLTGLFTFLFLREALPGVAWGWSVGALCVALAPLLGEMSGGVNPDALLYAEAAALFYLMALVFRRGLTPPRALAVGALLAVGLLTKLNFVGLVPGAVLGLVFLTGRAVKRSPVTPAGRRAALRPLALALGVAASPLALYLVLGALSGHLTASVISDTVRSSARSGSPLGELSYIWQLYLPALPGTHVDFPGVVTAYQVWFNGYVGLLGWLDTTFPAWVYELALIAAGLVAALCARALVGARATLPERRAELLAYGLMGLGVMALVGAASYLSFVDEGASGASFEPRYLLPLLPLAGLAVALAIRGAGRRLGPVVGALLIVLFLAHDVFGQLQVIARYYG